jgi:hypothetical protein
MEEDRVARKVDVSFFVLKKRYMRLNRAKLESEVRLHLSKLLAPDSEGKLSSLSDEEFIPILNEAVELERKSYGETLPPKKRKKKEKA